MAEAVAFNSSLENGLRALIVLAAIAPDFADLQRLVLYDYILVHSGDVGGPPSIHPSTPSRGGELIVRRGLVEQGVMLMASRNLIERFADEHGIGYRASEEAYPFIDSLTSPYIRSLRRVADWIADTLQPTPVTELQIAVSGRVANMSNEFFLGPRSGEFPS